MKIKYDKTFPHNVYLSGRDECELDYINSVIKEKILKVKYDYFFDPTRDIYDSIILAEFFDHIEIEKDGDKYYACIYTGTTDPKCEIGSELIHLVESDQMELAISLAAYESISIREMEMNEHTRQK